MNANGTIIEHAYGWTSLNAYSSYGVGYAGYADATKRYAYFSKFKTPEFVGASKLLTFSIPMYSDLVVAGSAVNLRYAICTSDENSTKYMGTAEVVEDDNQIVSGTIAIPDLSSTTQLKSFEIPVTKLASDTTYYLVLWSFENTGVSIQALSTGWGDHTLILEYTIGFVYIKTEEGKDPEPHQKYIFNGEGWDLYISHIKSETDWDQCG